MRQAMGLSDNEFEFLKDYRRLEELEREKGIKFFECVGDPPASHEFKNEIVVKRQNFIDTKRDEMRHKDIHRFATEVNSDKVVVPVEIDLKDKPKWNVYENNHFAMRKRLVGIFLRVANKLITRIRAGKRLVKIKHRIDQERVYNREDMKRMVAEDWKTAQNARIGGSDDQETNIDNVKFKFCFNTQALKPEITMPIEFETNIASFMEKIDAQPVISFDDFEPFQALEQLDFEVMQYKPFKLPGMSTYDPMFKDKPYRPGCMYESTLRQIAGEPNLEKI